MALLAYNLTSSPVTLVGTTVSLPATGEPVNVTAELQNLTSAQFSSLEAQRPNTVQYRWTDVPEFETGTLVCASADVPVVTNYNIDTSNAFVRLEANDGYQGNTTTFGGPGSTAVDGDIMVVGAPNSDQGGLSRGAAYFYRRSPSGAWTKFKKVAGTQTNAQVGVSVAVSGDDIAVGAYLDEGGSGRVYIYSKDQGGPNNWGLVKYLTAPGQLGFQVSLENGRLAATAYQQSKAYVYEKNEGGANNWGQVGMLTPPVGGTVSFGNGISLSGDYCLVQGVTDGSIKLHLFYKDQGGSGNWGLLKTLDNGTTGWAQYRTGFAIQGDMIAVGAPSGSDPSYVFIYLKDEGGANNWGQKWQLPMWGGGFGTVLALSKDLLVVNGGLDNAGDVMLFHRNQCGSDTWGFQWPGVARWTRYLNAGIPYSGTYNGFGASLATDGSTLAIGHTRFNDAQVVHAAALPGPGVYASDSSQSGVRGLDQVISAGSCLSGDGPGGNVVLRPGTGHGTGAPGFIDADFHRIAKVKDPEDNQDAATKAWVIANFVAQ